MNPIHTIWRWLRSLGQRSALQQEIDEELRFHLEQRTAENVAVGMSPEDAAREARRRFGNHQTVREDCREVRGASFGETTLQDVRFGLRMLFKKPGFTAVAVLTLALGIGANTTVFSWIRAVLLDAVPGAAAADRLVVLCPRHISGRLTDTMSVLDNRDLAAQTNIFAGVTGSQFDPIGLRVGNELEWVWGEATSPNFFDVLKVTPALGRFFLPNEAAHPGGDGVVVLSHSFWRRRFGGDANVLGRVVELANRPFTVIGVAPANFHGGMGGLRFDLWVPFTMAMEFNDALEALNRRHWRSLHTYARLQPGVGIHQAQAAANGVMQRLEREYSDTNRDLGVAVLPVWKSPWGGQSVFLPLLRSLAVVTILLLLLVIANVGNLLLARGTARQQEIGVRLALGAKRSRIARQLLTESVLLAGLGGVVGCLFAAWGVGLIFKLLPPMPHLPIGYNMRLNGTVLFFSGLVTVCAGILFGLAPALQGVRTSLNDTLKHTGRSGAAGSLNHRLRNAFVVCEIALALVLLVGMTLCARSLQQARKIDRGLDPRNIWVTGLRLPVVGYDDKRLHETYRRLREELAALPGVQSVSLAQSAPLSYFYSPAFSSPVFVESHEPAQGENPPLVGNNSVGPNFFRTLGVPLLSGREFTDRDREGAPRVAIVNETLVRDLFPNKPPATVVLSAECESSPECLLLRSPTCPSDPRP